MAELLLLCGKIAFGLVGFATGFRLWRTARTGRAFGIHTLAAVIIFLGGIGLVATSVSPLLAKDSPPLAMLLTFGGDLLQRLALLGLCVFIWRVFRPHSGLGIALTALFGVSLFASFAWDTVSQPWPYYDASSASAWSTQLAFGLPFAWSTIESGVEWSRGRRKHAIGLMPRIAVERFAMWSLACGGFVGICVLAIGVPAATDAGHATLAAVLAALRGVLYLGVALAVWIGMFMPAFYVRRFATDGSD